MGRAHLLEITVKEGDTLIHIPVHTHNRVTLFSRKWHLGVKNSTTKQLDIF